MKYKSPFNVVGDLWKNKKSENICSKREHPEHMPYKGTTPIAPGRSDTLPRLYDSRNCAWNDTTSGRNDTPPRVHRLPVQKM
jgi:hypothetical protein